MAYMLTEQIIGTPGRTPNLSLKCPAFLKAQMFLKGLGTDYLFHRNELGLPSIGQVS